MGTANVQNRSVLSTGYVRRSVATLLFRHNKATAVEIVPLLFRGSLDLTDTFKDTAAAYASADFVVIAAPINTAGYTRFRGSYCESGRQDCDSHSAVKEPLNKWTRADCEEIRVRKRRKRAGILTDFKRLQRIYGANLPQGAEVHLFRGSLI